MDDSAQTAAIVYEILATRWPGRFRDDQLTDQVPLGAEGLGLDSIEIVEFLLECEERLGGGNGADDLLEAGPISIGDLIGRLANA
ncbi:MAG: hypothetical protein QOJ12_265 [Thermoleophilales bacterium]|nr:hypothetical protein [Thermoleophilales bacterium]